jgi:hypothetical protein
MLLLLLTRRLLAGYLSSAIFFMAGRGAVRAIESLGALRGEGRACGVVGGGVGAECRPVPALRSCRANANANARHAQAAASTVPDP